MSSAVIVVDETRTIQFSTRSKSVHEQHEAHHNASLVGCVFLDLRAVHLADLASDLAKLRREMCEGAKIRPAEAKRGFQDVQRPFL